MVLLTKSTFVIDSSKLSHRDDIRADDLGVWKNDGAKSTYCSIAVEAGKMTKVRKLSSKPSVMRNSIYRVKRTYWHHADDVLFCRRLIEIEGIIIKVVTIELSN